MAALSGIPRDSFIWVGWAGCYVPPTEEEEVINLLETVGCYPVFLSDQIAKDHYNGFSNSILWPLFHYQTGILSSSLLLCICLLLCIFSYT